MATATLSGGPLDGQKITVPSAYDSITLLNYNQETKKHILEFYELSKYEYPIEEDSQLWYDYDGSTILDTLPFQRD